MLKQCLTNTHLGLLVGNRLEQAKSILMQASCKFFLKTIGTLLMSSEKFII